MLAPTVSTLKDGRYRLKQILGEGGMATVFRAWDNSLGLWRAIKVLSPGMSMHAPMRERFETEARTMAGLRHPNILEVYDVGHADGRAFFVMELMDGGSLEDYVRVGGGSLTPAQAVWAIDQSLAGLEAAHAQGIIHRDIKPDNILLNVDGVPKLADFGIARVQDDNRKLTRTGSVLGTWAYMAPEQRTNAKGVDARADIYGMTATLFALLTGREPFDLYTSEVHDELFAAVPPALQPIIERGCRYRRDDRFSDVAEMRRALAEAYEFETIGPVPQALPPEPELTEEISLYPPPNRPTPLPSGPSTPALAPSEADAAPTGLTMAIEPEPELTEDAGAEARGGVAFWVAAAAVILLVFGGIAWFASSGNEEASLEPLVTQPDGDTPTSPTRVTVVPGEEPQGGEPTPAQDPPLPPSGSSGEAPASASGARSESAGEVSPWGVDAPPPKDNSVKEPAPATPDAVEVGGPDARTITVRSWPPADVLVNKVKVGRTPLTTEVGAWKNKVTLVSDEGSEKTINANVNRGETWSWCWNFERREECER